MAVLVIAVCTLSCQGAAPIINTVATASVGDITVTCNDPGNWKIELRAERISDGRDVVTFRMGAPDVETPPSCDFFFTIPGTCVRHVWTCMSPLSPVGPNNISKLASTSELAKYSPIAVAFDEDERSIVAIATTEVFEKAFYSLSFNDKSCALEGRMRLLSERPAPRKAYETKFYIDRRGGHWSDTVKDASKWISEAADLRPAAVPEAAYEALYSTWYAYWQDVHDKPLEEEARRAAALGMKTMILDDGWQKTISRFDYSKTGDWNPVASRFPDMKRHVKKVHEAGLKYLLWYSVPLVGEESEAFHRFQGKFLGGLNGNAKAHGTWVLDPRFPEVREFLIDVFVSAVREWDFDGLKLDFVDQFVLQETDPAVAENYAGRDFRSVPEATDKLMKDILTELRKVKPDVLVEFRQRYMGPAMLQYGNMMRALDCQLDPSVNRRRIADLRLTSGPLAVHSDMLMWCPDEEPEDVAHPIISALFGVVQYSMVLGELPKSHLDVIRHWIGFANRHREAILKGAFRAHHPEAGYPLLESESRIERVMAVYASEHVVPVLPDRKVVLVNGSRCPGVYVNLGSTQANVKIFDVIGRKIGEELSVAGLCHLPIPKSGYAEFVNPNSKGETTK